MRKELVQKDQLEQIVEEKASNDVIELDISGILNLKVSRATLCSVKGSKLETKFNAANFKIEEGKPCFIDRDHQPFELMISYLRND